MSGRTVDVHAHAIVPEVEAAVTGQSGLAEHRALDARRNGAESLAVSGKMVAARIPQLTGLDRRLADMDAAGIDVQVVSPSPSQYHYWADRDVARVVTESANRGIAALVAEEPSRLVGLGLIPLQHPEAAVAALDDAVLTCGLAGVEISSFAPGVELSDGRLEPFWARAAELGAVVFLHPFGCSLDERLDRFYLSNTVGQPVENAAALSHVIFSGVLDRHPALKLLAAHGGGYLPTYIGRSDRAWEVRPEARRCADRPSTYLSRITFDSLVHGAGELRALVDAVGPESVVLGSDYPFDMGNDDPVAEVHAAGLSDAITRSILGDNAIRLGLSPAPSGVTS
ncbi:amidohydrolase [Rhodococcus sp. BP-149]|uniref:amidohydrolase family protein n=1 Tax=unclassified Rhodococcus (in: high G+C Gram-positive bacteria) TaxID=192944 RepID=UPI001C9AE59D|nr:MULTISPECIES: amidohydrolase family protein [unclassified Rhodococcus (in: high G+C Gram-positive bacteria)]MBY6685638.1 amidohydrolase [Rhodococcus sp. BP-288]MBY6694814.1 amidohydrolase [Rhodococcus sp. BP-188]MBY6696660.1 amidohydrolase [Rhodococcus sp. BP-285]MBY6703316.1 amidohydrolase [Rhodococcus sp. BP-283]MBY6710730.1 amidohydrolase [Rhodococcus sp. BP-160]